MPDSCPFSHPGFSHEWPWSTQPHRTWTFVVIPVYHPTAMWEAQGRVGTWPGVGGRGLGPAGSLTVCRAVKMGPGSYSVSVLECADEGERKGRWWVGWGWLQTKLLSLCWTETVEPFEPGQKQSTSSVFDFFFALLRPCIWQSKHDVFHQRACLPTLVFA